MILWLLILSLGMSFLPLLLVARAADDINQGLRDELSALEGTLSITPTVAPDVQALREAMLAIRGEASALNGQYASLEAAHINWPRVAAALLDHDPALIQLETLIQSENRLTLTGQALNEREVTRYADALQSDAIFSRVIVQAITRMNVPTPAAESSRPTATPGPFGYQDSASFSLLLEMRSRAQLNATATADAAAQGSSAP